MYTFLSDISQLLLPYSLPLCVQLRLISYTTQVKSPPRDEQANDAERIHSDYTTVHMRT